jgi:hypothetical protein
MKIIKPGRIIKPGDPILGGTCQTCGCSIAMEESDYRYVDAYGTIHCPTEHCGGIIHLIQLGIAIKSDPPAHQIQSRLLTESGWKTTYDPRQSVF